MAFESLTDKLQNVFKNLRSKGRLTEADVKSALKEVKMALLEADVNFKVVKQFVKSDYFPSKRNPLAVYQHLHAIVQLQQVCRYHLSKMDGDTRGGAALSVRSVTSKPILFVSTGEKLTDIEQFYPDRMANRILGMGDVPASLAAAVVFPAPCKPHIIITVVALPGCNSNSVVSDPIKDTISSFTILITI